MSAAPTYRSPEECAALVEAAAKGAERISDLYYKHLQPKLITKKKYPEETLRNVIRAVFSRPDADKFVPLLGEDVKAPVAHDWWAGFLHDKLGGKTEVQLTSGQSTDTRMAVVN